MTIKERIELAKLGYSKEEIKEISEQEKTETPAPVQTDPQTETPKDAPQWALDLTKSINSFVNTVHANNIIASGDDTDVKEVSNIDILGSIIGGKHE